MKNQDYIELIEDYIKNTLPSAQQQKVEQRMATDEDFRKEVELHRQMQEHYKDAGRRRLLSVVQEVMNDNPAIEQPPQATAQKKLGKFWKWVGLLAVLLIAGFLVWKQTVPKPTPPLEPATTKPLTPESEISPDEQPFPSKPSPEKIEPPTKPKLPPTNVPIAEAADPADFIPHKTHESNISGVRGGDVTVMMSSPTNGSDFIPGSDRLTKVIFKGTIAEASQNQSFILLIYSNRDVKKALLTIPLETSKDPSGNLTFNSRQSLDLKRGLYYFYVVEKKTEVELYTGKFTIWKSDK